MMEGMNVEWAAAMGFRRDVAERSMAMLDAAGMPHEFGLAMDVARFLREPLDEATMALVSGSARLRRLGFRVERDMDPEKALDIVRAEVAGQAEAYTHTIYGSAEVREAQGHTFSQMFSGLWERWFGPRV